MTSESTDPQILIKNRILEIVNSSWTNGKNATLIAKLGSILTHQFDLKKDLKGLKLADFIRKELSDVLDFVDSPKDPLIKALIPIGEELDSDITKHFKGTLTYSPQVAEFKRININRSVWKAFSLELQDGYYRNIKFEPKIQFEDSKVANQTGYYSIDRNLINPLPAGNKQSRNVAIQKNILEWAAQKGINEHLYLLKASEDSDQKERTTLFQAILEGLDANDLSRVAFPLDIVIKLQNKFL